MKRVKNPQFNFLSQNLSIERNFFKWDGKETKISHLLFHRIWKKLLTLWELFLLLYFDGYINLDLTTYYVIWNFFLKNWPKTQFFNWDGNKVGSSMIEYKCDVGKEDLIWTKNVLTSSFNVNIYGYKNSYLFFFSNGLFSGLGIFWIWKIF